jgi:glycosyltransferase involved in cell wall biosynthesis
VPLLAQDHADRPPSPWRLPRARRDARAWKAVAFTAREQAIPFREAGLLGASVPVHEVLEASSDFSPGDRRDARRQTGIHGDPAFLWVGHLDANKDPLTVLDGLATVLPRFVDPHLWCCYRTAPLLTEVRSRIAGHPRLAGLAGRVHLLGERPASEIELLLRAADAFVLGSHREGSGYAVLEAMACGTPPIVTGVPSLRRIAGPGLASLLWTPGNAGACAAALGRLAVEDPADLRARTRLRFEQALAWDAVGRELRAAYDACLDGAQSPAAAR